MRESISPKADLEEISKGLRGVDDNYLVDVWRCGVQALDTHPDRTREFAYSAAVALARLDPSRGSSPDHAKHAVIVTAQQNLDLTLVAKHWSKELPVSVLRVVTIPDLVNLIVDAYERSGKLTHGQLAVDLPSTALANLFVALCVPVTYEPTAPATARIMISSPSPIGPTASVGLSAEARSITASSTAPMSR